MNSKPLPCRSPPLEDELLSSWITRLAQANHCSGDEFCGYLGLEQGRTPEQESDLKHVDWDRFCHAVQRTRNEIVAMALTSTDPRFVQCAARSDFQSCLRCTEQVPGLVLRHWRFAWSLRCEACGQMLTATHLTQGATGKLRARAARGAEVLKSAVVTGDLRVLRRIDLTMHLMNVLGAGPFASLMSGNERARFTALAAISICTSRPLKKAAIVLGGNAQAVH